MQVLRSRSPVLWALGLGLVALVLLPLSHLGLDHSEDCPLCQPSAHGFQAPEVVRGVGELPRRIEAWGPLNPEAVLPTLAHSTPPGRAPPLLPAA